MEKKKEINYEKRSIPSGPGAKQITNDGCKSKKGGAPLTSKMPTEFVIPGADKKK